SQPARSSWRLIVTRVMGDCQRRDDSSLGMLSHTQSESFWLAATRRGACHMQRITREQARKYAFDWRDEPLLRVKSGEPFEIETYDASTGYFKTAEDKAVPALRPGFDRSPPLANPIGGPVWLEGAERGDTLVATVQDIL